MQGSVSISLLSLWVGPPVILVAILPGIASGKKRKGYKAIRVINSGEKNLRVCSCSSPFNLLHLIRYFVFCIYF